MSTIFDIKEHVVDAQHIREYPRATANSQEEVLQLAVKQYIPKDNPNPKPGDITIIASHANGFVKVESLPRSHVALIPPRTHNSQPRPITPTNTAKTNLGTI